MSLLTNPWMQIGMGLLANSGPSLTPVNPWRGIGQGLIAANEAKVAESEQQYRQQMMLRQQQEYEREAQRQQMLDQWAQTQPDPVGASLFPEKAYEASLAPPGESAQMTTAGAIGIPGLPPETPVEVKMKGGQVVDYSVVNQPQAPQNPSSYREWELAGKPGAYNDWLMQKTAAGATKVEMGAGDRASPSDVSNMIYPDQTPVLPGTPWPEIIAKGGRVLTPEEKAAKTQQGAQEAKDTAAVEKGGNLFADYQSAAKAYQAGYLPAGKAREQAKIARDSLVKWYAKNVLGTPGAEPSPSLYDKAEEIIPDFAGPWDSRMFGARMSQVKTAIESSLKGADKENAKQSGDMTDVTLMYNPKTKRLEPVQ